MRGMQFGDAISFLLNFYAMPELCYKAQNQSDPEPLSSDGLLVSFLKIQFSVDVGTQTICWHSSIQVPCSSYSCAILFL